MRSTRFMLVLGVVLLMTSPSTTATITTTEVQGEDGRPVDDVECALDGEEMGVVSGGSDLVMFFPSLGCTAEYFPPWLNYGTMEYRTVSLGLTYYATGEATVCGQWVFGGGLSGSTAVDCAAEGAMMNVVAVTVGSAEVPFTVTWVPHPTIATGQPTHIWVNGYLDYISVLQPI